MTQQTIAPPVGVGIWMVMVLACVAAAADHTDLYVSQQGGYRRYRIPAVVVTNRGTILAFCEGRKHTGRDTDDIDTMLRRSTDCGKIWSKPQVVADFGPDVAGNPCAVVDRRTGRVWLANTWNAITHPEPKIRPGYGKDSRRVFLTHSDDDGQTWARPTEITRQVKKQEWSWYATGPGRGVQLTRGPKKGRLIVPCDHMVGKFGRGKYWSHVIYSDDHGKTWKIGGSVGQQNNECEVVELVGNQLMLNARNWDRSRRNRVTAVSENGGGTFGPTRQAKALPDPHCQGSICRFSWPDTTAVDAPWMKKTAGRSRIVFSNAATTSGRKRGTIRLSYDEGKTWPVARVLHAGGYAYSDLAVLPDGTLGCLYEKDGYKAVTFARFTLEWLTGGKDKLP